MEQGVGLVVALVAVLAGLVWFIVKVNQLFDPSPRHLAKLERRMIEQQQRELEKAEAAAAINERRD